VCGINFDIKKSFTVNRSIKKTIINIDEEINFIVFLLIFKIIILVKIVNFINFKKN
jgi:hypothetical protein